MDFDLDQLIIDVHLGIECKALLENKVFKKLLEGLRLDALDAWKNLSEVDATNSKMIAELQNQIWRYTALIKRINILIQSGEEAAREIETTYAD